MSLPNTDHVLVFLCDQLRIDLMDCYPPAPAPGSVPAPRSAPGSALGHTHVQARTPHLAELLRHATRFDQARTLCPLSSPARASLLTGLYPHRHKLVGLTSSPVSPVPHCLPPDVVTLDRWLAARGTHETAYFGKWHIGPDAILLDESKFDHRRATSHPWDWSGMPPEKVDHLGPYAGTYDIPLAEFPDGKVAGWVNDFYRQRDNARPSLVIASLPGPHDPHFIPREFGIRYDPKDMPVWANRHDPLEGKPYVQVKQRAWDPTKRMWNTGPRPDVGLAKVLTCVFSYIELVDHLVGDMIQTLKDQGIYDRTAILFLADHGDMIGAHGFFSKGAYHYEETSRIPLIFKLPGQAQAQIRNEQVTLTDVTATLMHLVAGEACGDMHGQALQGRSLVSLLDGESWDKHYHYEQSHTGPLDFSASRMITDGKWKLVVNLSDTHELYDLEQDPAEMHNRFYDPAHAATRDRLIGDLLIEAGRYDDRALQAFKPEIEVMSETMMREHCRRLARPDQFQSGAPGSPS